VGHRRRNGAPPAEVRPSCLIPSTSAVRSTINPAGIRDDKRNLSAIVLIPLRKQQQLASEIHQM